MDRVALVVACLLLLTATPAALAHEGGGDGAVRVVSTAEHAPRVGESVGFTYYIYEDGALVPHVDTDVVLTQNGEPLTTFETAHEHDGVFHVNVRFTQPGPFTLTVTAELDDDTEEATLTGTVQPAAQDDGAELDLEGPEEMWTGSPAEFTLEASHAHDDGSDHPVHHADAWVRVYRDRDDKLVQRARLHLHDGEGSFQLDPAVPGTYTVRAELYPWDADHPAFEPTATERTLDVMAGTPAGPPNTAEAGTQNGDHILVRVDPMTMVGPQTDVKVNALYLDDDGHTKKHIDFAFKLVGPSGNVVFASEDAHQHDGILETFFQAPKTGTYTIWIEGTPKHGGETDTATASYQVVPPVYAAETLPGWISLHGADDLTTGQANPITLEFTDASGQPVHHVEADMEMYQNGGDVPVWTTKLHAHERDIEFDANFLAPGDHYLKVNPSPQTPSAQVYFTEGGSMWEKGFGLDVAGDPVEAPAPMDPADTADAGATLPTAGTAWVGIALLAVAWVLKRR